MKQKCSNQQVVLGGCFPASEIITLAVSFSELPSGDAKADKLLVKNSVSSCLEVV